MTKYIEIDGIGEFVPRSEYDALAAQVEALKDWRLLALKFDGHRMQAMSMLKMVATGDFDMEEVRQFIAAASVSGKEHLRELRAEAVLDAVNEHTKKYGNSHFGRHLREYAEQILQGNM